ncbi:MAG TPA: M56 family metallopeptidase [Gemmatimonadaceae bacterium]|nr:M56 family metallopeptidase [Gemmatimonadaceae bacterium]
MMTALGWAVLHAWWQGAVIAGTWWWLARRAAPQVRYRGGLGGLGLLAALFAATAWVFARPHVVQPHMHDAADSLGGAAWGEAARVLREAPSDGTLAALLAGLGWGWVCVAGLLLLRHVAGWLVVHRRYVAGAEPPRSAWTEAVRRSAPQLGLARTPEVLESARIDSPAVFGVLRPVLLMPRHGLRRLTSEQVESLIVHELVHLRRRDGLVNLLQCVAEALLFFHPLVRTISRRLRSDREALCDRVAAAWCGDPRLYLGGLLALEESRRLSHGYAMAAQGGELLERARLLLAPSAAASRTAPLVAAAHAAALLAMGALVAGPPALEVAAAIRAPQRYTIAAADPAGRFSLTVVRGRAIAMTLAGAEIPPERLVHRRDSLFVFPPDGGAPFALHLDATGGIRWAPRPSRR